MKKFFFYINKIILCPCSLVPVEIVFNHLDLPLPSPFVLLDIEGVIFLRSS